MVLIIFSPISSHVKQKERGKYNNEAHTPAIGGAYAAPRRHEKLGIKKTDRPVSKDLKGKRRNNAGIPVSSVQLLHSYFP